MRDVARYPLWTLFGLALAVLILSGGPARDAALVAEGSVPSGKQVTPPPHPASHTRPFIDGAMNPEAISDEVANRLFLRMLMTPEAGAESTNMQRSYIRHVLRPGGVLLDGSHTDHTDEDCAAHKHTTPDPAEIESVVKLARSYEQELRDIDRVSRRRREEGDLLGAQRTAETTGDLAQRVMGDLANHVGASTAQKIQAYISHRVKKSTKIFL